jgi:hypothetical protein
LYCQAGPLWSLLCEAAMSDWMKTRAAWVRSKRRFCLHFGSMSEGFRDIPVPDASL